MGFKTSTVKALVRQKLDNWLASITDENVREVAKSNVIVSGGAIASYLLGDTPNDFDLYFRTKEATLKVARYYVNTFNENVGQLSTKSLSSVNPEVREEVIKNLNGEDEERVIIFMKSSGVASETQSEYAYFESKSDAETTEFFDSLSNYEKLEEVTNLKEDLKKAKTKYRPVFMSDNAITLSDKVQIVIRFFGEPDKILTNYDFVHCMNWYDYENDHLALHPQALECLLSKTLIYKGSLYPLASVFRIRKFIERGYRITAGQILKILFQVKKIDFHDPKMLREQLIGVDFAYMKQLIERLDSEKGKIDDAYIARLIDEIFE